MTPMPTADDIMFLANYRPYARAGVAYARAGVAYARAGVAYARASLHLILWWYVVLCVFTALAFHYICNIFHIFPVETHALYVIICRNMGSLLEYANKNCDTESSRTRIIMDRTNDEPYLLRYYLLIRDRVHFPFNIFIHKFMKGDEDDVHDHPWGFFHIVLSGGYWEYITVNDDGETLTQGMKKVWRPPGHWNIATTKYKHKVELGAENPWTIFIPFGKRAVNEPWGFWVQSSSSSSSASGTWTKTDNATYLENKAKKTE